MPPGQMRVACAQLPARELRDAELSLNEAFEAMRDASSNHGADIVVLPECTYPAYFMSRYPSPPAVRDTLEVEQLFAEAARDTGIAVMVGLAARDVSNATPVMRNSFVLFDDNGKVVLRGAKRLLWDFDRALFQASQESEVAELRGVRVGGLVCADARLPEIARLLAVQGVDLILDPTAWVTIGTHLPTPSNPQPEYVLPVRAIENGVWIAAADKVGTERNAVTYCGRSSIIAPDGTPLAVASAREPEVISATIDATVPHGPPVQRHPELYESIAMDLQELPIRSRLSRRLDPADYLSRVVLLQESEWGTRQQEPATAEGALDALDANVFAFCTRDADRAALVTRRLVRPKRGVVAAVLDEAGHPTHCLAIADESEASLFPTHGKRGGEARTLRDRTFDVGELRVGILMGREGLVPEVMRVVLLDGAELVIWFADPGQSNVESILRTRALESRAYVALVVPHGSTSGVAKIADPDGRVIADAPAGAGYLVSAMLNVALARTKQIVPGTDILANRQPRSYASLADVSGDEAS